MKASESQKIIQGKETAEHLLAFFSVLRLCLSLRLFLPEACYFDVFHDFVVLTDCVIAIVLWNAAAKLEKSRLRRWIWLLAAIVLANCWKLYWLEC
jgi:hypothetical protein